ncbi:hypothetical protein ACIP98_41420, partial [Streptomyces sp. NPDC088354]|uniref:hypothetical protein n=1 Tax=Streptomyces sp. NPDC088354 TaxID=3365856 RepID=UPI003827F9CC
MRSSPRRWSVLAVAGAAVLSLAHPATASPDSPESASSAVTPARNNVPPGTHTVTLITGDVVTTRQSSGNG